MRDEMEWGVLVLQTPDVCRLYLKRKEGLQPDWDWWCQYRCPGFQRTIGMWAQGNCPDPVPLPSSNRQ